MCIRNDEVHIVHDSGEVGGSHLNGEFRAKVTNLQTKKAQIVLYMRNRIPPENHCRHRRVCVVLYMEVLFCFFVSVSSLRLVYVAHVAHGTSCRWWCGVVRRGESVSFVK